jgi:hypothetical protein
MAAVVLDSPVAEDVATADYVCKEIMVGAGGSWRCLMAALFSAGIFCRRLWHFQ